MEHILNVSLDFIRMIKIKHLVQTAKRAASNSNFFYRKISLHFVYFEPLDQYLTKFCLECLFLSYFEIMSFCLNCKYNLLDNMYTTNSKGNL